MNRWKICSAVLALVLAFLCVPASNAQTPSIPIVAVGSSGFFGASGLAAITKDPIRGTTAGLCGDRFWTGTVSAVDARTTNTTPNLPHESASAWIAWDNDATPTIICVYFAADSIVGQRLFFGTGASGNATLLLPTNACSTPGADKIAFIWDTATVGVPLPVYNALMGTTGTACPAAAAVNPVHFNVAFTDVRPEDAQFIGINRVLCNDSASSPFFPTDTKNCLGFGPGVTAPGTAVLSSYSGSSSNSVDYSFTGTDPITSLAIPQSQTISVGAQALLVFVGTTNTASGGFGNLVSLASNPLTNVNRETLGAIFTGQAILTRDVYGGPSGSLPAVGVHALLREPQSGTYTTFEWQGIRRADGSNDYSQETGILAPTQSGYAPSCFVQSATAYPTVACSNPVSTCFGSSCGLRTRVIGTGQMISIGNTSTLPDTMGYAFWSVGNYGNKLNLRYLTVDGVDPLFPSYSVHNGVFPGGVANQGTAAILAAPAAGQCGGYYNGDGGATITSFSCNAYALPTFDGVQNGNYRLWNYVRASYYGTSPLAPTFSPLNITGFILSAQNQTAPPTPALTDIVPTTFCGDNLCTPSLYKHPVNVFRAHYAISSWGIGIQNNGIQSGSVENGGDVAGAIFNVQTEVDFGSLFGNTFLTYIQ